MGKKLVRWVWVASLAILITGTASLAMPPKQGLLEPDPLTGLSKLTGKSIVTPPPRPVGVDSPEPFKKVLVTGTNKILLIVIDYPDLAHTQTRQSFDDLVNDSSWQNGSLNDYFQEVSYNQFGVNGVTIGWYTSANNHTYYANNDGISGTADDYGFGAWPNNAAKLAQEAVDAAEAAGVDFSQYDNNGDGYVDTVFIVHAGKGGEATGNPSNIWSHKWSITGGGGRVRNYDGVTIDVYNMQPELNAAGGHIEIGVFAHEYGHVLGLPDLYDTDGTSEGIGNWGLMAGGSWGGDGNSPEKPVHPCAWSKIFLGWLTLTVIQVDTLNQQINPVETHAEVYKLWRNGKPDKEYFLVSNRQKTGFDANLRGSGLLIWHIDEDVINDNMATNTVNGDENHKGVDLEEADGLNHLDNKVNRGDAGDPWPGSSNKTTFNRNSNPNSLSYYDNYGPSGLDPSGVEVSNISASPSPSSTSLSSSPMYADLFISIDELPLAITHEPVSSATCNEPLIVTATVPNEDTISSFTVYFKKGGEIAYSSAFMVSGSSYQATIPSTYVTERGLEYYLEAEDIAGNVATSPETNASVSPYTVRVNFSSLSFPFSTLQGKWQMISVPVELDNTSSDSILVDDLGPQDDTVWKLYGWNNEEAQYDKYPDIPNEFIPGKAFWLITKDSKSIDVEEGTTVDTSSDYAIGLASGWTQIACPFAFAVNLSDVKVRKDGGEPVSISQAQDEGWVRDKIWYYDGDEYIFYEESDGILEPWEGYWMKALVDNCELLIPAIETESSTTALSKSKEDYLQILAKIGELKDSYNFIGFSDKAKDTYDKEDVEKAPPIPPYVSLFFHHPDWGKDSGFFAQDIRKTPDRSESKIIWDMQVRTDQIEKMVSLEWKNTQAIPEEYNLYLADEGENVLANMREEDSYFYVASTGKESFQVIATADELSSPEDLTLTEVYNYPNPARDETTNIHFRLGKEADVTVKIYTIAGELVRTLIEGKSYTAGVHDGKTNSDLQWNLTNDKGSSVTQGVYILLVEAKNPAKRLVETTKIAVIKK